MGFDRFVRTFRFRPHDAAGNVWKVEAEVTLRAKEGKPALSICAEGTCRDIGCEIAGQCLDTIQDNTDVADDELWCEIYDLWSKYHLNDMRPGTPEQMACLSEMPKDFQNKFDGDRYAASKEWLAEHHLLNVELADGTPYIYGHAWLYHPIPDEDLARIQALATMMHEV